MGYTIIYPEGKTTGHSHKQHEEIYFVIQGRGRMIVGETEYDIKAGDALYVPFGVFHTTYNNGITPLQLLWVTAKETTIEPRGDSDMRRAALMGIDIGTTGCKTTFTAESMKPPWN